jgi:hypothetical protein
MLVDHLANRSPDARDSKLIANLTRQPIIDLPVPRYRDVHAIRRIGVNAVASALSHEIAAVARQVIDKLVPFHNREAPTCTDSGTSSIRSASIADASGFGVGKGLPSSSSNSARSSIALAIISRASGKSKP